MDTTQSTSKIFKRSPEEISSLVEQWRASGKNKSTFCRENKINYMTFIGWTRGKKKKKKNAGFIPFSIHSSAREIFSELSLPGGAKIIFHSPVSAQYLRAVLS